MTIDRYPIDKTDTGDVRVGAPGSVLTDDLDAAFAEMVQAVRTFQDALAASRPTVDVARRVQSNLGAAAAALSTYRVDEAEQIAGKRFERAGRSQAMSPVITYSLEAPDRVEASVEFGRFYLGGNGAVHGGVIPLVFDELLGRLANEGRPRSRTANLQVNFRKITPIEQILRMDASVDEIAGRKLYLSGSLHLGDDLLADAKGLFVILRPGQP